MKGMMCRMINLSQGLVLSVVMYTNASRASQGDVEALYEVYRAYIDSLTTKDLSSSAKLLTRVINEDIDSNSTFNDFSNSFPIASSIDSLFDFEVNHHGEIDASKACLTVIGYDVEQEPASLSIEMLYEQGAWRLNFFYIVYYESQSEWPESAKCSTG